LKEGDVMAGEKNGNKVLEDAAKKAGGKLAQEAIEDVVEDAVVKSAAKVAAQSILKIGLFGKLMIAVVCVAVIVGIGYFVYSQISNREGDSSDDDNMVISTVSNSPVTTNSDNTDITDSADADSGDGSDKGETIGETIDNGGMTGELNGTFVDEDGFSMTFDGDTVIVDLGGYIMEGKYTDDNGILTLIMGDDVPFAPEPSPYTLDGNTLTFDGAVFTKQ
jgi:hypothetical protein